RLNPVGVSLAPHQRYHTHIRCPPPLYRVADGERRTGSYINPRAGHKGPARHLNPFNGT
ncbi:hypothetical protein IscW_ISCW008650, partial [Ixodes scapularis]